MSMIEAVFVAEFDKQVNWQEWSFCHPNDLPTQRLMSNDCGPYVALWALSLCCGIEPPTVHTTEDSKEVRDSLANIITCQSVPCLNSSSSS